MCYRSPTFDVERLKRATRLFMGTKDFRTFSGKPSSEPVQYVRQLNAVTVEKGQPFMPLDPLSENFEFWNITVSARSFLYNQVHNRINNYTDNVLAKKSVNSTYNSLQPFFCRSDAW